MSERCDAKRRGRKPLGDPIQKASVCPRASELALLREAAELSGKTFSRYVLDAALEKAASLEPRAP